MERKLQIKWQLNFSAFRYKAWKTEAENNSFI